MRYTVLLPLVLAACAEIDDAPRLGPGDVADVTTTAIGLAEGFTEANPLLAQCGPAAPACAAIAKPALKYVFVEGAGMTPRDANIAVEGPSWMAGCANLMVISGAAVPLAAAVGVTCGLGYFAQTGVIPPHDRGE